MTVRVVDRVLSVETYNRKKDQFNLLLYLPSPYLQDFIFFSFFWSVQTEESFVSYGEITLPDGTRSLLRKQGLLVCLKREDNKFSHLKLQLDGPKLRV